MHASLEQLIGLRDEEPVAAEVRQHVRACAHCARILNDLAALHEGLAALPDLLPPAGSWDRITAAAQARERRRRYRWLPAAGVGLAASVAGVMLLVNARIGAPAPATVVGGDAPASVSQLMAQSRYLERAVLDMNDSADKMAVSAGTASTIAALEDRIALVDYEINNTPARSGGAKLRQLWKQRVDLLQSLAAVRYAQVANTGI